MAEGGTGVDDHEDVRTCSICMEDFNDPKLLPCFHTFCLGCLHRLTSGVMAGKQFPCPVCRHQVTLPTSGPPGFQTNFYIEAAQTRRDFHGTICEICSKPATCRCNQCVQSLCEDCAKVHSSLTLTKSHSLIRLRDTSKYRPAVVNPEFCTKHVQERLRFQCNKCEKPICRDCKMTSHEGHSTVDLEDVVDEGRKTLAIMKSDFMKLETKFLMKDNSVKDQIKTFSKLVEEMRNDIDRETDDVITKINNSRESQKMEIEKCYLAEMKCLKTTEEAINQDMLFVKSHTEFLLTLITGGCGADIMKAVTDMKERFDQLNNEKQDDYHGVVLCRQKTHFSVNSTTLLCISEPAALEVVSEFECSGDGSAPDIISPVKNQQAWVATNGHSGNGYVRLFTAIGKRIKEFVLDIYLYVDRRKDGILQLIPCSDTEEKCKEIDGFRSDIKLKHTPKTDTIGGMTCTVDILNQCITVVNTSNRTKLKLSRGVDFAPTDVCWGPDGKIVIVDRASNSVLVYRSDYKTMSSFVCGRRDKFRPCAVAWDGGSRLWIGDLRGIVFVCEIP